MGEKTKAQRQQEAAQLPRCACGNIARSGSRECRSCENDRHAREEVESALAAVNDLDELKDFIREHVLPRLGEKP